MKHFCILVICLFIVTGCGPSSETIATQTATAATAIAAAWTATPTSTSTFTPTPTPTNTNTPTATATSTPTNTSTPTPTPTITPTPTPVVGRIQGKVYWQENEGTIENALVELVNNALESEDPNYHVAETLTDENGEYVFDDLEPGEYGLNVTLNPDKYEIKTSDLPQCTTQGVAFGSNKDGETLIALSGTTKDGDTIYAVIGFTVEMPTIAIIEKDLDIFCR